MNRKLHCTHVPQGVTFHTVYKYQSISQSHTTAHIGKPILIAIRNSKATITLF